MRQAMEALTEGIGTKQRQTVTVELAKYSHGSSAGMPESNLYAFIEQMRHLLDTVPPEWRAAVEIEFGAFEDRDGYSEPRIWVWYNRPETAAEESERIAKERADALDEARRIREQAEHLLARAAGLGIPAAELGFGALQQAAPAST